MQKNKFSFVCPMFNASKTLTQMLYSLYGQSFDNWRIILIDDCSDHDEQNIESRILQRFDNFSHSNGAQNDKITVIWNSDSRGKQWEVSNVLYGISMCDEDDIICRIDADDFLCDLDALRVMNEFYMMTKADCVWTAHRWFDDRNVTNINISKSLPDDADVYKTPWVTSHLKSFRKKLINEINDENFRGSDGQYIKRAGDQAIYLPILHVAKKKRFLPMVTYAYRCDLSPETFQTIDAKFQKTESEFLRARGFVK